jgi:hypothetical protein
MGFEVGTSVVNPVNAAIPPCALDRVLDAVLDEQPLPDLLLHVNVQAFFGYNTAGGPPLIAPLDELSAHERSHRVALVDLDLDMTPWEELEAVCSHAAEVAVPLYRTLDEAAQAIAAGKLREGTRARSYARKRSKATDRGPADDGAPGWWRRWPSRCVTRVEGGPVRSSLTVLYALQRTYGDLVVPDDLRGRLDVVVVPEGSARARLRGDVLLASPGGPQLEGLAHVDVPWIQLVGTGLDAIDDLQALARGRTITNSRGAAAIPISEWVLAMMLAFAKRLPQAWITKPPLQWTPDIGIDTLCGRRLGLVGLGAIGSAVAHRALAFGMEVGALRRRSRTSDLAEVEVVATLHALLERADHVVLAAPLTPATEHLIDAHAFGSMKRRAPGERVARRVDRPGGPPGGARRWHGGAGLARHRHPRAAACRPLDLLAPPGEAQPPPLLRLAALNRGALHLLLRERAAIAQGREPAQRRGPGGRLLTASGRWPTARSRT